MMSYDDNPVNFLSDIQPSEKNWDTHRAEAESVRLLYSLSTEFTKYATRIYDCSQVLKFAPTPDKLVLKHAFSVVLGIALFASGEGLCYGGLSCSSNYQQSKKNTLHIVGCPNAHR